MPKAASLRYESDTRIFAAGRPITWANWVPDTGPNGRRLVIDYFTVKVNLVATVGGLLWNGADQWRMLGRVRVSQVDGRVRRDLLGDELRIMEFMYDGAPRVFDPEDQAIAAGAAFIETFRVSMGCFGDWKSDDTSMPGDVFKEFQITCPTTTDLSEGATAISAVTGDYAVIAHCHEDDSVRLYIEDIWKADQWDTLAQTKIPIGGLLWGTALHKRGANGGADQSAFPAWTIDGLQNVPITLATQRQLYLRDRELRIFDQLATLVVGDQPEPFTTVHAVSIYHADMGSSFAELFEVPQSILVRAAGSAVTDKMQLTRVLAPKSAGVAAAVMAKFGVSNEQWQVASAGKSRLSPELWDRYAVYAPLQAPYRR